MTLFGRRTFVAGAALLPALLVAPRARATLMRGLPLRSLCAQSQYIVLVRPIAAECVSLPIGGRAMIVTETKVQVDELLSKTAPSSAEVIVRTLGGALNGVGELVHGQAELSLGVPCLAFLKRAENGALWITGMAQGHYPILSIERSEPQLRASPRLPTLRDFEHSAVRGLVGQTLAQARSAIAREGAQ